MYMYLQEKELDYLLTFLVFGERLHLSIHMDDKFLQLNIISKIWDTPSSCCYIIPSNLLFIGTPSIVFLQPLSKSSQYDQEDLQTQYHMESILLLCNTRDHHQLILCILVSDLKICSPPNLESILYFFLKFYFWHKNVMNDLFWIGFKPKWELKISP